jgi:hypothetical protein
MLILRNIFGGKALNAVSGFGAAVHEERHSENIPLRVTEWIDLDQSLRRTTAKFKTGPMGWKGAGSRLRGPACSLLSPCLENPQRDNCQRHGHPILEMDT